MEKFTIDQLKEIASTCTLNAQEFMSALWHLLCRNKEMVKDICKAGRMRVGLGNAAYIIHQELFKGIAMEYNSYNSYE